MQDDRIGGALGAFVKSLHTQLQELGTMERTGMAKRQLRSFPAIAGHQEAREAEFSVG